MSKRKLFIILYSAIFLAFGIPYVIHLVKLGTVASQIALRESEEERAYENEIASIKSRFISEFPDHEHVIDRVLSRDKETVHRDTIVSYFVYWNTLEIESIVASDKKCLTANAKTIALNEKADEDFDRLTKQLEQVHGDRVQEWIQKLGRTRFLRFKNTQAYCDTRHYIIDSLRFADLDRFLIEYDHAKNSVEADNTTILDDYNHEIDLQERNLSENERKTFRDQLARNNAIKDGKRKFEFTGDHLGQFEYVIPGKVIDQQVIEDALNYVFEEKYKNHSLNHGDMPYGYCYGTRNSGSSGVRLNAGNSDVLLMIKDSRDHVIRHVYVRANRSYTLYLPNGYYSVYFYSGKGWNPKKKMKATYCGDIIGGFLFYEDIQKDPDRLYLHNQIMEYTLRQVVGGNFSTANANPIEAF